MLLTFTFDMVCSTIMQKMVAGESHTQHYDSHFTITALLTFLAILYKLHFGLIRKHYALQSELNLDQSAEHVDGLLYWTISHHRVLLPGYLCNLSTKLFCVYQHTTFRFANFRNKIMSINPITVYMFSNCMHITMYIKYNINLTHFVQNYSVLKTFTNVHHFSHTFTVNFVIQFQINIWNGWSGI